MNQNTNSIFYQTTGSGKPVMLVHGFAEDHRVWEHQINTLKKICRVITPDLPGSGRSELSNVSMENMADALRSILDKENITSCIMIGHSMGGYVTLAFAEKYPEMLDGFGLFHSTAYADSEEKKQNRRKAIEFIKKNGTREFLKTSVPNLFAKEMRNREQVSSKQQTGNKHEIPNGEATPNREEMIKKLIEYYQDMEPQALIAYYEAMIARPDLTNVLKNFTKPVLMILGVEDNAVPYEQGIQQFKLLKKPSIHTLQHSGHMGMWEQPAESNSILADYINNVI